MARRRTSKPEVKRPTLPLFPSFGEEEERPWLTYADLTGEPKVVLEGEPDSLVGHDEMTDPRAVKVEAPPPPPTPLPEPLPPAPTPPPPLVVPVEVPPPPPPKTKTKSKPPRRLLPFVAAALCLAPICGFATVKLLSPRPLVEPVPTEVEVRAQEQTATRRRQLGEYGWVDRDKRIIRIPIERAMQQVADGKR